MNLLHKEDRDQQSHDIAKEVRPEIQKIAKKNSMSVVTIGQGEKEAKVTLPFIDFTAPYRDAAYDRMAIYDTIIRNQKWIFERMFNLEH